MRFDLRRAIVLLGLVVTLSACSSESNGAGASLQVSLLPQPLRVGPARVVTIVRDVRGRPIADARVTVITSEPALKMGYQMPMQGMGRAAETIAASGSGNGIYQATVHITDPTLWSIVVHAESPAGLATMQIYERAEPAAGSENR